MLKITPPSCFCPPSLAGKTKAQSGNVLAFDFAGVRAFVRACVRRQRCVSASRLCRGLTQLLDEAIIKSGSPMSDLFTLPLL